MSTVDRRSFLKTAAAGSGALALAGPLQAFAARAAGAAPQDGGRGRGRSYGPIAPVADHTTGLELLALPAGFEYWSFGDVGTPMSDGLPTPAGPRRHGRLPLGPQDPPGPQPRGPGASTAFGPTDLAYDSGAGGGNTIIEFDPRNPGVAQDLGRAQRHQHQLRRWADAVAVVAHLRGDDRDAGQAARLRVRGARLGQRVPPGHADPEHGPLRPRGPRGRAVDQHHLPDRGRRRHVGLLPPRADVVAPAARRRQAADAQGRRAGQRQPRRQLPGRHHVRRRVGRRGPIPTRHPVPRPRSSRAPRSAARPSGGWRAPGTPTTTGPSTSTRPTAGPPPPGRCGRGAATGGARWSSSSTSRRRPTCCSSPTT